MSGLKLIDSYTEFANHLFHSLGSKEGNILCCPLSAHVLLSMLFQGAGGTTAELFLDVLKLAEVKSTAEELRNLIKSINSIENGNVAMVNKIYFKEGFQLRENYRKLVVDDFLSEIQAIDFKLQKTSAKIINAWVKTKTNKKIRELIKKDDLNQDTQMILINAIYFEAEWYKKFHRGNTKTCDFYLNRQRNTAKVKMMRLVDYFNYKYDDNLKFQVIELPYKDNDLSMFILLPGDVDGVYELEKTLAKNGLTKMLEGLQEEYIELCLPRFNIEMTMDLGENLIKMGLSEIFDKTGADLSEMLQLQPSERLHVSKMIQKVFISVNEEGTVAGAVTGLSLVNYCMPTPFSVDHPFLFVIACHGSKLKDVAFPGEPPMIPIFCGRVLVPL